MKVHIETKHVYNSTRLKKIYLFIYIHVYIFVVMATDDSILAPVTITKAPDIQACCLSLLTVRWSSSSSWFNSCCQVAEQLMTIAYESGINLFDTAEVYAGGR